jgi:hypothetical protein
MKGNVVTINIANDPTPGTGLVEPQPSIKKVVQWVTVRHPEGGIASYPMFLADEGLPWLETHKHLRPEDEVIGVSPCTELLFVIEANGQLDLGTTVEDVQWWAEQSRLSYGAPAKLPTLALKDRRPGVYDHGV